MKRKAEVPPLRKGKLFFANLIPHKYEIIPYPRMFYCIYISLFLLFLFSVYVRLWGVSYVLYGLFAITMIFDCSFFRGYAFFQFEKTFLLITVDTPKQRNRFVLLYRDVDVVQIDKRNKTINVYKSDKENSLILSCKYDKILVKEFKDKGRFETAEKVTVPEKN